MNQPKKNIAPIGVDTFEYIELGRTFHELSKYASENDSVDITQAFHVGEQLSWENLTQEHRVIILAEAGSGKTAEIRNVAKRLHKEGRPAFFLRLENIPSAFELAFEIDAGSYAEFRAWRDGSEAGWIFLDSVDEAKLRHPRDFELAITKLAQEIGSAKDRAHILITGRTTAWRPKSDLAHCQRYLPYGGSMIIREIAEQPDEDELDDVFKTEAQNEPTENNGFKIVTLDDLRTPQLELFAAARGINDTKAFLESVERADAWSFTTRPQDLEDLTSFWLREGRVGSRLEIMVNSIERRLTERDQSRDEARPLAMDLAQDGARLLAAATTLSKETNIRVPDGAANTTGIPVGAVLHDWDQVQQRTLLERPIFDEVIYEAVRFHHRSVREYLTAIWFASLLTRDTSRRQIEGMFFREQYGVQIVTPTLRPILPWLMLMDDRIRERVLDVAPDIALEGGDPSQLPVEDRRRILRDVCAQIATGTSQRSTHDYAAVQRFSGPDLAQDIRDLLQEHAGNDELAAFLLRMVWLGQLKEALPDVMAIAMAPSAEGYKRLTAFRALNAVGSELDRRQVREGFASEGEELDRDLLAELIEHLEPTAENTTWLLGALGRSAAKERYSVDRLGDHLAGYINRASLEIVATLVEGLLPLLSQPPVVERRHNDISQKFEWLLVPAAKAVERLIKARHPAALEPEAFAIIRMISVARLYQSEELHGEKTDFSSLVSSWPELNKAFFWFEVERTRENPLREGDRMTYFWHASIHGAFWSFGESDFDYASNEIANQPQQDNKLVALSLAFDLYRRFDRPAVWRRKLKSLTEGNQELSERLGTYLKPPAQPEQRRWKNQERKWKKRREAHEAKQAKYHADWNTYLKENFEKIVADQEARPGEGLNPIWYLFSCTRDDRHAAGRWTEYNWQKLIPRFGEPIARFFRDTAVTFWRHYQPKLQSEGAPDNQTANGTILGLTGLEIESHETSGWPDGLSAAEVELACRYASFELNGFPTWFPRLFQTHPDIVGDFLMREMSYELSVQKPDVETHYMISDVSWSGQWCWDWIAPRLCNLFRSQEPVNLNTLGKLLKVLQGSALADAELATLAAKKCRELGHTINAALWFAVWTGVAPEAAIPELSARLDSIIDREKRVEFAMSYVTHLSSGRRGEHGAARGAFHKPPHLKSLYILINEHVRREDDIERAGGGVYSPGLRDNAQDARNGLIELLLKIPGKEAYVAIREVADAFPDRPWFGRLAKEHAERDGDLDAISPQAVRDLSDNLERTPTNHRELAALAEARLLDLKDELENGDTSIAAILRKVDLETDMRKYIGKELRDKAHGRYNIPQEEELADAKKPDLRFHGAGFDGPVPSELKLADKWSGPDLMERLENQLCGDYLRDSRSNRGFFVLVYQGEKTAWDLPEGRVDFEGLVAALQGKWNEISAKYPGIDDIGVIGIDLTKRDQKVLVPAVT